ncbi:MAG: ATP-binding cassette domain-containing protein [Armatimonadetes bacterium]|nr:ATP-binding cassette domain-containing protein [Armatimonadota bacterium]
MTAQPAIAVENVGYRASDRVILSGVSFNVARGEVFSLMGQSGSGKTTLLKCLGGLIRPTGGSIRIDGHDIAAMGEADLNRVRLRIGFVFQYAALFDSMTVFDNVAFGLVQHRRAKGSQLRTIVRERLADVHLEGAEGLYPAELSGGMQKRVGLARALAIDPAVLLYDEPTSGLDPVTGRAIDDLIVETRDRLGVTSVVVSHDIPTVLRISDRAAMISEGMLVALDTPEGLRDSDEPLVREFVHSADSGG